ncbi:nucleotidyltransferase family protein [Erythrobacter rubeus]|uniref:Nucleotidyltransferase family protein n=1 Tax=Erythrobacter rubeus TaxID=2760803 RepID=A0ABR8KNV7_9SPHN|nr:nucleotidyltransferase family protein [Erythrobacter rubeus]MBD2841080.1 nucleotidyltransferase family protein [Erythrobacter rubeus]
MAEARKPAVALLAAGSSRRFGQRDKLAAEFRGEMLGCLAARAIPRELFEAAWVIIGSPEHPCAEQWERTGFAAHVNPDAERGMGTSVACAARLAQAARASGLLIALSDMPLVPAEHFRALAATAEDGGSGCIAASSSGSVRMPPAIFGADHFETLSESDGDGGARTLLSSGVAIDCPPDWLVDIDTPEDLARYA